MGSGASSQKKKKYKEEADADAATAAAKAAADAAAELAAVKAELAAMKAAAAANGNGDRPLERFAPSTSSDSSKPETTASSGPAKSEVPSTTATAKVPASAPAAAAPTPSPTSASPGEPLGDIDPRVVQMLIECHEELEMNASGEDCAAGSERKRTTLLNFVRDESALDFISIASMREIVNFISAALFVAEGDKSSKAGVIASSSRVVTHVQFDAEAGRGGGELAADKAFAFDLLNELRSSLEFRQSSGSETVSRKYILGMELLTRSFIFKLVKAFHCDGAQERNKLMLTLHQSLFKLPQTLGPSAMNLQSPPADMHFVRHVINSELYRFIYETQLHSGISELLTVYESICRGFKMPLKEEHREFLFKVLMPLHSVYALPKYFKALELCIMNYLRKVRPGELNAKLRETVDVFWPVKSPEGAAQLLRSEYLELILTSEDESGAEGSDGSLINLLSRLGCCKRSANELEAAAATELLQKIAKAGKNLDASEHLMDHQEHSLKRAGSSKLKLQMRSPTRTSAFGATTDVMASALEECRQKNALYGSTSRNIFHATPWKESASMRPLSEAMQDVKLISAGWLVQLAKANVRPPRCQDIPPEAVVALESLENSPGVPILVISYPWLARAHPDELGEQLQFLAFIFKAFYSHAKKLISPLVTVGVFWDYLSLPQPSLKASLEEPFVDDRTPEEKATFKKGLRGINTWYAHPRTTVILMTNPLPTGMDYLNKQPYAGRGWCVAERRMSGIVKHSQCLINAGVLDGSEGQDGDVASLIRKGAEQSAERDAPTAPHKFRKELEDGINARTIKFTHPSDVDLVCRIYTDAFLDTLGACEDLNYSFLGWGDQQIQELVESFQYYLQKRGPLTKLRRIELHHNNITDDGLVQLASVVHEDAMPNLTWLGLSHNNAAGISERGRKAVQDAVSEITKMLADSTSEKESDTLLHVKLNRCRSGSSIEDTMTEIADYLRSPNVVVTAKQVDHIVRFTHWWVELDGLHTEKTVTLFDVLRTFLMKRCDPALLEDAFDEMWIRSVLIEAFDTPRVPRRAELKQFTYGLYAHCKKLRHIVDDAMLRALQAHVEKDRGGSGGDATGEGGARAIVEDERQDGSGDCYFVEILEVLEAILKGYKPNSPTWETHCSDILERTLLPLHGSSHLTDFYEPLFRCTRQFLEKDPTRVAPVAFEALSKVLRARGKNGDCSDKLLEEAQNIASVATHHAVEGLRVEDIFG